VGEQPVVASQQWVGNWHFSPSGPTMMATAGTTGSISRRAGEARHLQLAALMFREAEFVRTGL